MTADPHWNHNVHYHPVVLAAVPDGCRTALDVGCGDGLLARKLAARAETVTGVDRSVEMIRLARETASGNATFLEADYLGETALKGGTALKEGGYDFVSAVAVVHHTRFEDAVARLTALLAPGGRLVIVGLARDRTVLDLMISVCALLPNRLRGLLRGGEGGLVDVPVEDPAMPWGEVRRAALRLLPGCRYRRRLLWRYTVVWDKPPVR